MLGLKQEPDFVLASGVMYDPEVWDRLLGTLKALSGSSTLVLLANRRRPNLDATPFYDALSEDFDMVELSQSLLHQDFRRQGANTLMIHALRRK